LTRVLSDAIVELDYSSYDKPEMRLNRLQRLFPVDGRENTAITTATD